MEKYNQEVQECIDFLSTGYTENNSLDSFHILHIYPKDLAFPYDSEDPIGFVDSRMFKLVGFNTAAMERREFIGQKDGLDFYDPVPIKAIRIFADGSTLVKFRSPVKVGMGQSASISV